MSLIATEALIRQLPPEKFRGLQKATVVNDFDAIDDVAVLLDGDTVASQVTSLVGELQEGQRVMVLFTEPGGGQIAWLLHPPAWRALFPASGWSNLNVSPFGDLQIRRVGDNVEIRGVVKRPSGAATKITTLPDGFLPPYDVPFNTDTNGASVIAQGSLAALFYNGGGVPATALSLFVVYSVTP